MTNMMVLLRHNAMWMSRQTRHKSILALRRRKKTNGMEGVIQEREIIYRYLLSVFIVIKHILNFIFYIFTATMDTCQLRARDIAYNLPYKECCLFIATHHRIVKPIPCGWIHCLCFRNWWLSDILPLWNIGHNRWNNEVSTLRLYNAK